MDYLHCDSFDYFMNYFFWSAKEISYILEKIGINEFESL